MRIVSISASPKQLSKLRNGHRVRIKKGEGFNLVVSPDTYRLVARTFSKNKGVDIALSPEEIELNKLYSPESHQEIAAQMAQQGLQPPMQGQGIFSKIKKGLKKAVKGVEKGAKAVYKVAKPILKPVAHELVKEGLKVLPGMAQAGLTGLATITGQPELIPIATTIGQIGGKEAQKQLGRLNDRYLGSGFSRGRAFSDSDLMAGMTMADKQFLARHSVLPNEPYYNEPMGPPSRGTGSYGAGLYAGRGLYAGNGLYAGRGLFAGGAVGDIGHNGGFVRQLPPALQSQPYSANFHFQFQLPPQYQEYEQGPAVVFQ